MSIFFCFYINEFINRKAFYDVCNKYFARVMNFADLNDMLQYCNATMSFLFANMSQPGVNWSSA